MRIRTTRLHAALLVAIAICAGAGASRADNTATSGLPAAVDSHPQFTAELAKAKAAGIPTELYEIFPPAPADADENAAPIYQLIRDELKRSPLSAEETATLARILDPSAKSVVFSRARSLLRRHPELLRLAHEAAGRPFFSDQTYTPGGDPSTIGFPLLSTMLTASSLITAESIVLAHDGEPVHAVACDQAGFQIADHAASDPLLIQYLVAARVDVATLTGMQRIMALSSGAPKVAAAVQQSVMSHFRPRPLAESTGGDAAMAIAEVRYMALSGPDATPGGFTSGASGGRKKMSPKEQADWDAYVDRGSALLVKLIREEIAAADLPYPQAEVREKAVQPKANGPNVMDEMISAFLLPTLAGTETRKAATTADGVVTIAAADVFVWKAKHGRYPDELNEAMTTVPTDPFDLKPLRYRREGVGFVVCSVGSSLKYDGQHLKGVGGMLFRYPER